LRCVVEVDLLPSWGGVAVGLLDVVESVIPGSLVQIFNFLAFGNVLFELIFKVLSLVLDWLSLLKIPFLDVFIKLLKLVNIVLDGLIDSVFCSLRSCQELSWGVHDVLVEGIMIDDLINDSFKLTV
jgi:hypothetical protein